jgi:hypothetical protein
MTQPKPAREYEIWQDPECYDHSINELLPGDKPSEGFIHAIEYSAFQAKCEEVTALKAEVERLKYVARLEVEAAFLAESGIEGI